ncbi:flagellar hook-length control protein FliK [Duganella sp. FT3S]|uniref:Flagellar hook-length control protein FliK n=1 Tax=Rugamonas fusca TaxID=2758568 RepID=A0A7W2EGJ1_9BURK|nr:flagellar hook-length control protein FliK [Rugamonas fusca]MBA5605544.1 flagellar hook-length control protein FliK [Rugamonas fusca]
MLPRLDVNVGPLTAADAVHGTPPIGDGRQAAFQRNLQALVGQSLQATVLSKYPDGSFLVRVADNAARMLLPPGVQVGSEVPLTVIAAQPRPTFQLGNAPGAGAPLVYSEAPPGGAAADAQLYHPSPPAADTAAAGAARLPGTASGAPSGAPPGTAASAQAAAQAATAQQPLPAGPQNAGAAANGAAPAATATAAQAANLAQAGAGASAADHARPATAGAALLAKAPLIPASALPSLDASTPPPTLSAAARVLTTVLTAAPATAAGAAVVLTGKSPLVAAGAPPVPEQLAQHLQAAISQSGLFYESHVAEWVKGERSLAELMREPQMQRQQQALADGGARPQASGPDLSAALMINQQLHAHEQGRVQWQGEAWPGQPMQWEVRREPHEQHQRDGRDSAGGQPEQVWRSGVRFRFPLLGKVAATVTLAGDQVQIQLQTDTDQSAVTLRAYADRLEQAMAAAGAPLSSLTIAADATQAGDSHEP